jgi:hypothetical protein
MNTLMTGTEAQPEFPAEDLTDKNAEALKDFILKIKQSIFPYTLPKKVFICKLLLFKHL